MLHEPFEGLSERLYLVRVHFSLQLDIWGAAGGGLVTGLRFLLLLLWLLLLLLLLYLLLLRLLLLLIL